MDATSKSFFFFFPRPFERFFVLSFVVSFVRSFVRSSFSFFRVSQYVDEPHPFESISLNSPIRAFIGLWRACRLCCSSVLPSLFVSPRFIDRSIDRSIDPSFVGLRLVGWYLLIRYEAERVGVLSSLKRRAEIVAKVLDSLEGVSCRMSDGALYAFPSM